MHTHTHTQPAPIPYHPFPLRNPIMARTVDAQIAKSAMARGEPVGAGPEFRDMKGADPNDPWNAFRQYQIEEGVWA
jgi:hypothetical protein